MLTHTEIYVLQLIIQQGLCDGETILSEMRTLKGASLSKTLIDKEFLSQNQWDRYTEKARALPQYPNSVQNINRDNQTLFVALKKQDLIPSALLEQSLKESRASSPPQRLEKILTEKKYIAPQNLSNLGLFENHPLTCESCQYTISLGPYYSWHQPPCPICSEELHSIDPSKVYTEMPKPVVGENFGKYKVLSELGKGGMGALYKAYDPNLKREVALKVILDDTAQDSIQKAKQIRRFQKEARLAAKFSHPQIVPVNEVDEYRGTHYISMAYIEGTDLGKYVEAKGPLSQKEALEIMIPITQAVAYAHEQGVLHRDIKPSNIMVDGQGNPLLMDFGLAKRIESDDTALTKTGDTVGTPDYMAPEQALGGGKLGPGVDQYGLGGVLYFLLSGRPPFQGTEVMQLLMQVINDDPPCLRGLCSEISRNTEVVVHKCLEKEPRKRYPSVDMLAVDLKALHKGNPIMARPPGKLERTFRWAKKRKKPLVATATVLLIAIIGIWLTFYLNRKASIEKLVQQSKEALQKASSAEELKTTFAPDQRGKGSPSPQMMAEINSSINHYSKARNSIEEALTQRPDDNSLKEQRFEVEREIGRLALLGRIYLLGESSIKRLKVLAWDKETTEEWKTLQEKMNHHLEARKTAEIKRIGEIMASLISPPSAEVRDEYVNEMIRMRGENALEKLAFYLQKGIERQRLMAIEVLGKLRDRVSKYKGKDVGQWLMERLEKIPLKKTGDNSEALALVWAIGRLRDGRANELVEKKRVESGQNSNFWDMTRVPFSWLPEEGPPPKTPEGWSRLGLRKFFKGQYHKAISDFNRAIKLNPKFAKAYSNRGNSYQVLKQSQKAIADYRQAIKLNPKPSIAYNNRGMTYYTMHKYKEALSDLNQAIKYDRKYTGAYSNRGMVYIKLQQYEKALADFDQAIRLDPQNATAYNNRGRVYQALKKKKVALSDFSRAIELNPKSVKAYNNRGLIYRELQQYQLSILDLTRAIELNPEYTGAYYNRGIVYHDMKLYRESIADYTRVIELNPKHVKAYFNRGRTYGELKKYPEALSNYNRAIQLNQKNARTYSARGNIYQMLKQNRKALSDFNRAIELNPKYATAYYLRAISYSYLNNHQKAFTDYKKTLELNPKYSLVYYNRGVNYYKLGERNKAIREFKTFLKMEPRHFMAPNARRILRQLKRK